jgi:hypothetical protein
MKPILKRKWLIGLLIFFASLNLLLGAHIYLVTRKHQPNAQALVLARLDFPAPLTADVPDMLQWFNRQPGIHKAVCSPQNRNLVFGYFPTQTDVSQLIQDFNRHFNQQARRFLPGKQQMKSGCPIGNNESVALSHWIAQLF